MNESSTLFERSEVENTFLTVALHYNKHNVLFITSHIKELPEGPGCFDLIHTNGAIKMVRMNKNQLVVYRKENGRLVFEKSLEE